MNFSDAAAQLGLSPAYVASVARQAGIVLGVERGRLWFDRASLQAEVERRAQEADRWVSYVEAARIAGCSPAVIGAAVRRGEVLHRTASRGKRGGRASIDRESAREFGERRKQELADRAAERASTPKAPTGPPDEDQVWLTTAVTALMLGVSPGRICQLVNADRLPHVRVGKRIWFRRRDIELVVAARAFRLQQRQLSRSPQQT